MNDAEDDGRTRCGWAARGGPEEIEYHDTEWGVPVHDDRVLFEFLILEGAQAGLSWKTILLKRAGYRAAFAGFDPERVARLTDADQATLLGNRAIVRNRLKVASSVTNARAFLAIAEECGSFDNWLWDFVDGRQVVNHWKTTDQVPVSTPLSDRLSKALKKRGFKFVGTTICYSYLQATGLINDHLVSCFRHAEA